MSIANIICPACGKEYAWQQQLAGHTVRCTCGQVMPVPAVAVETDSVYALAPAEDRQFVRPVSAGSGAPETDDLALPCPSCRQPIPFGGVVCPACGYNVKTGLHDPGAINPSAVGTPASWQVPTGEAPAPEGEPQPAPVLHHPVVTKLPQFGIPPPAPKREFPAETRQEILKRYFTILGAIAGLIVLVAVFRAFRSSSAPADMHPEDAVILRKLQSDLTLEPLRWLDVDPERRLGRLTRAEAKAWIDSIYREGAKNLWCYGPRGRPELYAEPPPPEDVEARARFFRWYEDYCGSIGVAAMPDVGQKYLRIELAN
ncbi:MAG: hypothetical protein RMJ35_02965 [Phycisphaerales bacterium]|nr:hypothetical protein [Phycisphaerales bacterium]